MGNSKHKLDCGCTVCTSQRAGEARRKMEAEALATYRAAAKLLVLLVSRMAGQPAPDAVAALAARARGSELDFDPAVLLRAAGITARGPAGSWSPGAGHRPAASQSRTGALWAGSPDHDPRVVQAIVRGASDAEISRIRAAVTAEYAQVTVARQAAGQRSVMWRTRSGEVVMDGVPAQMGASFGPDGAPRQTSVIHNDAPGE